MDQNLENKPVFDAESLTKKVIQLIALSAGKDPKKLSPDQPVFSIQGQFDSFALMELVLHWMFLRQRKNHRWIVL